MARKKTVTVSKTTDTADRDYKFIFQLIVTLSCFFILLALLVLRVIFPVQAQCPNVFLTHNPDITYSEQTMCQEDTNTGVTQCQKAGARLRVKKGK